METKAATTQDDVIRIIGSILESGAKISKQKIADRLNGDGVSHPNGGLWTGNKVRHFIDDHIKPLKASQGAPTITPAEHIKPSDVSEPSDSNQPDEILLDISDVSEGSVVSDMSITSDNSNPIALTTDASELSDALKEPPVPPPVRELLPNDWRNEVMDMIRQELAAIQTVCTVQPATTMELAPVPGAKEKGKKDRMVNPGERVKVGITLDKALFDLLDAHRKDKSISLSRAMDTALWSYLGKPLLSFEKDAAANPPASDERTEQAPSEASATPETETTRGTE